MREGNNGGKGTRQERKTWSGSDLNLRWVAFCHRNLKNVGGGLPKYP